MRTLKKSLCLVLALVMVLGLCMIGANATYANYTDNKKINYADAVEVLTGLNVIEGYPDGEFKPAENVTRAEAAAMITRMMLGREKADKLPIGDVKFNDVPETNWAAKYISFCANKGIIVGVGNGNFEPSRNVTGTELACMLLRALGYGTMGEYEGKGWDINAVADALYHKVFEDTEVTDFSQPATREETALYVWNTMRVELVGYDVDLNYYRGKGTDFAGDVFSLRKWTGVQVIENQATGNKYTVVKGLDVAYDEDGDEYYDSFTRKLEIETELDLIAHEVTVYYKVDKSYKDKENNRYWKAYLVQDNSTILDKGAYYGDTYKAFMAENKNNKYASLNFDGWINYVYSDEADTVAIDTGFKTVYDLQGRYTSSAMVAFYLTGEIILDSNGKPLAYMKTEYTVDKVKKITDEGIILQNDEFGFETYDPELAYEGIQKGDFVTVQPVGELCYLYPTTTQEISVTERNYMTDLYELPYFNFYAVSPSAGFGAVTVPDTEDPNGINAGDKALFYLDYYGAFFAAHVLERGTLKGVVFVNKAYLKTGAEDKYGDSDKTVYVQCVDEKGEEVIYALNDSYTDPAAIPQGVYKVFTNSKDEATLSSAGVYTAKEEGKTSFVKSGDSIYYVTSDTKVYYVSGEKKDMKVKAGGLTKDACNVYAYVVGSDTLKTIWITDPVSAPNTDGSYLYVNNGFVFNADYSKFMGVGSMHSGSMLINDETSYYFTVYVDGVKNSGAFVTADSDGYMDHMDDEGLIFINAGWYTYSIDEFGRYTLTNFENTSVMKAVSVTLVKGNIHNGKLYLEGETDGISITAEVVNASKPKTADGKKYLDLETLEDIEDLLNDDGTVTVKYLAVKSGDNWVPTGAIYITAATEPAE